MALDLTALNPAQREAVLHPDTPLLVLAGAGTGKTRVITHRIAHLVLQRRVYASKILAVTFTNKAARQMRERIEGLIGEEVHYMQVGTFHRQAGLLLRRYAERVALTPSFVIYDADEQLQLVRQCMQALNIDPQATPPRNVRHVIEQWKNNNRSPDDAKPEHGDVLERQAHQVYAVYQKRLRAANAIDFSDMLRQAVELLQQHDDVRLACQARWSHVLVDEYQDTNPVQYAWLRQIVTPAHSLTVVGDDDQSIYRWRGADIGNILRFERDFAGAHVVRLEENYRSTNTILQAANEVIAHNAARKGKTLFSRHGQGERIARVLFNTEREEAEAIASGVQQKNAQCPQESVAILYRTNGQSRPLEEALRRRQIAYAIVGGIRFYDRKEVKDALSYLRLLVNPQSDLDFLRVINVPARGLGKTSLDKLQAFAQQGQHSLSEAARHIGQSASVAKQAGLTTRAAAALAAFAQQMDVLQNELAEGPALDALLGHVLQHVGYLRALKEVGGEQNEERLRNLEELSQALADHQASHPEPSLTNFLQEVALIADVDSLREQGPSVVMMTLHAAKGLEFAHVFMPGLEEGLLPHARSLEDRAGLEEERRLCYVGMTRAQKSLMLSAARIRTIFGEPKISEESRFWREVPEALLAPSPAPMPAVGPLPEPSDAWRPSSQAFDDGSRYTAAVPTRRARPLAPVAKTADASDGPQVGQQVAHATFGQGPVLAVDGVGARAKLTVRFADWGQKTVVARFVTVVPRV